jgi:WD40 repeat protein
MAVSPDGRTVAVDHVDEKDRITTYDIATGDPLRSRSVDGHVGGLSYSPDGSQLAVTFCCTETMRDADRSAVELLDADTLDTSAVLVGGVESWEPSWSADGRHLLTSSWVGVRTWDLDEQQPVRALPGTDGTSGAVFVPASDVVVVAASGSLELVDVVSGRVSARHAIPPAVKALRVSPDGARAAFVDASAETVEVVDLVSGVTVRSIEFPSPEELRFSPDGTSLAIGGNAAAVHVVDLDTGEMVELRGHGAGVIRHAYAPDGTLLVSMREGGTRVWNLGPEGPADLGNLAIGGRPRAGQAVDDGLLVAVETGPEVGRVERVGPDRPTSDHVADFWFPGFGWPVFSPDGALVAGYSDDGREPVVLDVRTSRRVTTLRRCETPKAVDADAGWVLVDGFCLDPTQVPEPGGARTGFVALSDDSLLADAGADAVFAAAVGPPGSVGGDVVSYATRDHVVFRRASTLEVLTEWPVPADVVPLSIEFSPDGAAVGLSSQNRQGIVFDVEAILDGAAAADSVSVMPELHSGPTSRVVPVGGSVVTAGAGTQVRQWDRASGALLADVTSDLGQFVQLFALRDGRTLFYADANGVLRRFLVEPQDLVALARSRVQRGFTEAECERWFPDEDC